MKTRISILAFAVAGILLAGCATTGYKKADNASTSLQLAAQGIDNTLAPLDAVAITLADLVNYPARDITPQFQKFSAAVTRLESFANEMTSRSADMQAQGAAYFEKWDEELAKIQSDSIHTRSLDRKNTVAARFERVRVSYVKASADFAPFMSDLKDLRTLLATDLTAGGLDSVTNLAGRTNKRVQPLRESLMQVAAEFRSLGVSLSAGSPQR